MKHGDDTFRKLVRADHALCIIGQLIEQNLSVNEAADWIQKTMTLPGGISARWLSVVRGVAVDGVDWEGEHRLLGQGLAILAIIKESRRELNETIAEVATAAIEDQIRRNQEGGDDGQG